jgi:hypothetical protein
MNPSSLTRPTGVAKAIGGSRAWQMAGDAERRLAESTESMSPSTAVVVTRRNHEQIGLQEASCLGVEEPALGPFLQHCLDAVEHGPGSN